LDLGGDGGVDAAGAVARGDAASDVGRAPDGGEFFGMGGAVAWDKVSDDYM
jgi:hypothetical protein